MTDKRALREAIANTAAKAADLPERERSDLGQRSQEHAEEFRKLPPLDELSIKRLGRVILWRILVEPYIARYAGRIATPRQIDEAERVLSRVSRVLAIGHFCYASKTEVGLDLAQEPHKPTVGSYVLHELYAGTEVHLQSKHILRILTDTEVLMTDVDPQMLRGYV